MSKKTIPVVSIDSGIPAPERASYPYDSLQVGDSFLFPVSKRGSVQSRVNRMKREQGKEFTVKKMDKDTCRVWRIK
jgi:hypothetical protein